MSKPIRWSEQQLADHLASKKHPQAADLRSVLSNLGLVTPPAATAPIKRRRGVDANAILNSLRTARSRCQWEPGPPESLSLWFAGARMFTVNELISINQFRKYEYFRYKKAWRHLVKSAILPLRTTDFKPFAGPTRLVLARSGAELIDRDCYEAIFKTLIDALRYCHVLDEDHNGIVVDLKPIQQIGPPSIGIRMESVPGYVPPAPVDVERLWFGA